MTLWHELCFIYLFFLLHVVCHSNMMGSCSRHHSNQYSESEEAWKIWKTRGLFTLTSPFAGQSSTFVSQYGCKRFFRQIFIAIKLTRNPMLINTTVSQGLLFMDAYNNCDEYWVRFLNMVKALRKTFIWDLLMTWKSPHKRRLCGFLVTWQAVLFCLAQHQDRK